jgi:Armadillo/beta-catenin-like repeat
LYFFKFLQAVIEAGVGQRLVELLTHHSPSVQTPALRTVGNIVTGNTLSLLLTFAILYVSYVLCIGMVSSV